jgi:transcriptional regulator with XRE-family HTH domain
MTHLGEVLAGNMKMYRKKLGLSQEKLAQKVDTATNYIGMIESGKQFPSAPMLEKIARALEIDSTELFSTQSLPSYKVEKLQKDILREIEQLIADKLRAFESEHNS